MTPPSAPTRATTPPPGGCGPDGHPQRLPGGLRLGDGHRRPPRRGRRGPRRPWTQHLGHLHPPLRRDRRRADRGRGGGPVPPLRRGRAPHGRPRDERPPLPAVLAASACARSTPEPPAPAWAPVVREHLVDVLEQAHALAPGLPLLVTEDGAAYPDEPGPDGQVDDPEGVDHLVRHVQACAAALERGIPLAGYSVRSLVDDSEWAWGSTRRFGVVRVDHDTQQRTVKASGRWLRSFLRGVEGAEPQRQA